MRKLLLIFTALLCVPVAAHATITEVQHPQTSSTQCGNFGTTTTTTCTLTFPATGTGHFGIVTIAVLSQSTAPTHVTSITDNKGGSWLQASGCYFSTVGDVSGTVACAYNLDLAAGVTSITINWDLLNNEGARFDFREYSYTGSGVAFDAAGVKTVLTGTVTNPFTWATPSGLSGTNDVIVQVLSPCCGGQTAITTYGNLNSSSFYASADLLNTTSTVAPTSTSTDPGIYIVGWIAIRELQSGQQVSTPTPIITQHYDTARTGQK